MISTPPASVTWWPSDKYRLKVGYAELMFDSGCSHTSVGTEMGLYLNDTSDSSLRVLGWDKGGKMGYGDKTGTAFMIGFTPMKGRAKSDRQGWLTMAMHTMPGLAINLMSGSQIFGQMKYDIRTLTTDLTRNRTATSG